MTESDKIQIRLDLEGELAHKFNVIKKDKGIESNVDVVRNLISEAFKTLTNKKGA